MKVVFFEDVEGTAQVGDVKDVKNGFARNFLLPRGLAGSTSKDNLQRANSLAQKEARRQEKLDQEAGKYVDRLEGYTITLEARVGESGRLFGAIQGQWQAHNQGVRQPFLTYRVQAGPVRLAVVYRDRCQCPRAGGEGIADGQAGQPGTDIEAEHAAHA